jgi:hypothetical protein
MKMGRNQMIDDINKVWTTMNALYWFKEQLDIATQKEYLPTLTRLAKQLDMSGLEKEITDYLKLL